MSADPLAITFAKAADNSVVLAKVLYVDWSAEGPLVQRVETSPQITRHRFRSRVVKDLPDMLSALRGAAIAGEIAVRGEPRAAIGRRAIHDDREKGPAGLDEVPRQWVGYDWDSFPLPEGVDPLFNPEAIPPIIMKRLPPPFRVADCVVQISASAGVKPGGRARTWHLLDRPLTGADLMLWCKPAIERHLLDPVTLVETQPHYLSITVEGGHDPCPERFVIYRGGNGAEFVDCTDFGRVVEAQRVAEARAKAERERLNAAIQRRCGPTRPKDDATAFEASIRKAEQAIIGSSRGARHPAYVTEMARLQAIADKHGHDFGKARDRLRAAYLSVLTPDEARQRQRGSTDGMVRWLESRP